MPKLRRVSGEEAIRALERLGFRRVRQRGGHANSKLIVSFSPHNAQGLQSAKPSQLEEIEISPSGFGIHFPQLDADLYLPGLLEGFLGSRKRMASRLGQVGGQSRSRGKTAAAKANGRLGGRPKKAFAG